MKLNPRRLIACGICVLVLLFASDPVRASIIISEVHPAPSAGSEWVEIYNKGTETVSLLGWKLFDLYTTPVLIYSFDDVTIAPNTFYTATLISNKLNNSGDGLQLYDAGGQLIDEMQYDHTEPNKSWSRLTMDASAPFVLTEPTKNAVNGSPQSSTSPSPSPTPSPSNLPSNSPSSIPSPSPAPSSESTAVTITEIMACPEQDQKEWIELYNSGSTTMILENWRLYDAANNSRLVSGLISPNSYLVISWDSGILNNSGDSLFLKDATSTTHQSIEYEQCESGLSLIAVDDSWISGQPTPGSENSNPVEVDTNAVSENSSNESSPGTSPSTPKISTTSLGSTENSERSETPSKKIWQALRMPTILGAETATTSSELAFTSTGQSQASQIDPTHGSTSPTPALSTPSKYPILSAILGGLLLISSGATFIYPSLSSSWQTLLFGKQS